MTHDQKTGQLLAKIIKTRVADLDLYNPRFPLDCRISVNLEMRYDGDMESLIATADTSRMPDRKKDRLSYTQSHYQIDLTQVTVDDVCPYFYRNLNLANTMTRVVQGKRSTNWR